MNSPRLLATKFNIPRARPGQVNRVRLLKILDTGLAAGSRLTLICAPAGYGKTTLASTWVQDHPARSWLSLNKEESDPSLLLAYITAAIQRVEPSIGTDVQHILDMPRQSQLESLTCDLINDLAGIPRPITLVLDDYHSIQNSEAHDILNILVDNAPPNLHLVITTREDPPLPLSRLRARGQMTEIRLRDLRFTPEESLDFFDQFTRQVLNGKFIKDLNTRTEGWAAGLQLAALALQNQADPQAFLENFHGSHRLVMDYLADEVIRLQDEDIRQFLSRTSLLERMNASCCNALLNRSDSQEILQQIEQANLFIIPLDDERNWYRYHHLFADYLRAGVEKDVQEEVNKKAATWYEENSLIFEAVQYALASGDMNFAAGVIERVLQKGITWSGGEIRKLGAWLDILPAEILAARPGLSLHASRIFYLSGQIELAARLIDQAEHSLTIHQTIPLQEKNRLQAYIALFRGSITALRGEIQRSKEFTKIARATLPQNDLLARARAAHSLGLARELAGETEEALQAYQESAALARSAGVLFLAVNDCCAAAQVQISQGELRAASHTCKQAITWAGGNHSAPLGLVWSILGSIALEQNDLVAAEKHLKTGIDLSRGGGLQDDLAIGLVIQAKLHAANGNLPEANNALEQADGILRGYQIPRVSTMSASYMARLHLAGDQKELALRWAREYSRERGRPVEYLREFEDLTLSRVLLATGEVDAIPAILEPLLEAALAGGRQRIAMEGLLLKALVQQAKGDSPAALVWLEQAVNLAVPEGFTRLFLDENGTLRTLLTETRSISPQFIDKLLAEHKTGRQLKAGTGELPDPLTEQETRILQLIMDGKSNAEIAEELVISIGTAKWHVHNILRKLGARDRPQAIARAHEIGLT